SAWSATVTTATLADIPATVVSTWTVYYTSLTVTWDKGNNPANVTRYVINVSTSVNFDGSLDQSSSTYNLNASFTGLVPATTYYAEVKAVNHSGISTAFLNLGSTVTLGSPAPTGLVFIAATTQTLTAQWSPTTPPGSSYTLQVSTDINFGGLITSSNTTGTTA